MPDALNSLDLNKAPDHPAAVLYAEHQVTQDFGSRSAAETLRRYETEKGVTFAALDNDALAEVREAYLNVLNATNSSYRAQKGTDLAEAVNALLGLDNQ